MAQAGFTPISLYYSATASSVPLAANLVAGELSLNTNDGKLYYKNSSSVVTLLASTSGASGDVVGPASSTDNALARFDLATGKLIQNSVGILSDAGVLTGLTGLTSSGSITFSSLTSGRVPYATTAGLLTDSANLLYSGTDLTVYGLTVGRGAGAVATNTAVGSGALQANTTGSLNTAFGQNALFSNTTGVSNVALGLNILYANTTGGYNIATGQNALFSNTTGSNNTAQGYQALFSNTTASNNTAVGYQAAYSQTTGGGYSEVTAIGYQALLNNTAGRNTAVGAGAGKANTTGYISAFGWGTLQANTTGSGNSAFGGNDVAISAALQANTTGNYNIAVGTGAISSNTTGSNNTAQGYQALTSNTTASNNTAVGYQALFSTVIGASNVAVGHSAGYSSTGIGSGGDNVFVGTRAGYATTSGIKNTFVGNSVNGANGCGSLVTTGNNNVIIGGYTGSAAPISATGSNFIVLSDGDGVVRQTIDSSGNVGIGTTSPSFKLEAQTAITVGLNGTNLVNNSAVVSAFTYSDPGTVAAGDGKAIAIGMNARAKAYIAAVYNGTSKDAIDLAFWTTSGGVAAEAVRITNAGNVGIGQTSITRAFTNYNQLNISGSSGATIQMQVGSTTNANIVSDGNALYLATLGGSGSMQFAVGGTGTGTERMRIDSSGNVGIGTATPTAGYKLNVGSTSSVTTLNGAAITLFTSGSLTSSVGGVLNFRPQLGTTTSDIFNLSICAYDHSGDGNADGLSINGSDGVSFSTGGNSRNERMRIDSSGNLLVGITSNNASTPIAYFNSTGGSSDGIWVANTNTAASTVVIWNKATTGNNTFQNFGTEGTITTRGSISYNRAGGLTVYSTTSDYRAKDISGPVINSGALIDSIPVYMGKMKWASQERPMFIAHETPAYAHTGDKDAVDADGNPVYQQMDASALIPVMWAEIQSLRKRLAALESN